MNLINKLVVGFYQKGFHIPFENTCIFQEIENENVLGTTCHNTYTQAC